MPTTNAQQQNIQKWRKKYQNMFKTSQQKGRNP